MDGEAGRCQTHQALPPGPQASRCIPWSGNRRAQHGNGMRRPSSASPNNIFPGPLPGSGGQGGGSAAVRVEAVSAAINARLATLMHNSQPAAISSRLRHPVLSKTSSVPAGSTITSRSSAAMASSALRCCFGHVSRILACVTFSVDGKVARVQTRSRGERHGKQIEVGQFAGCRRFAGRGFHSTGMHLAAPSDRTADGEFVAAPDRSRPRGTGTREGLAWHRRQYGDRIPPLFRNRCGNGARGNQFDASRSAGQPSVVSGCGSVGVARIPDSAVVIPAPAQRSSRSTAARNSGRVDCVHRYSVRAVPSTGCCGIGRGGRGTPDKTVMGRITMMARDRATIRQRMDQRASPRVFVPMSWSGRSWPRRIRSNPVSNPRVWPVTGSSGQSGDRWSFPQRGRDLLDGCPKRMLKSARNVAARDMDPDSRRILALALSIVQTEPEIQRQRRAPLATLPAWRALELMAGARVIRHGCGESLQSRRGSARSYRSPAPSVV